MNTTEVHGEQIFIWSTTIITSVKSPTEQNERWAVSKDENIVH